jgi:hypothetical protein
MTRFEEIIGSTRIFELILEDFFKSRCRAQQCIIEIVVAVRK